MWLSVYWHDPSFVCAKKYSGKTVLMKYLMEQLIKKGTFDWGYIISATTEVNDEWNIIPEGYIRSEWKPEELQQIYKYQKEQKKNGTPKNCFILMDDVIGTVDLKDKIVQKLATSGRHVNIWLFIVVQKLKDIVPPVVRENAEFFIFFQNDSKDVLDAVHEQYMSTQLDKKGWYRFCNHYLVDYAAILINTRRQGIDKIRIFRAPDPEKNDKGFFFNFLEDGPDEEGVDPLDEGTSQTTEPKKVVKKSNVKKPSKPVEDNDELDLDAGSDDIDEPKTLPIKPGKIVVHLPAKKKSVPAKSTNVTPKTTKTTKNKK